MVLDPQTIFNCYQWSVVAGRMFLLRHNRQADRWGKRNICEYVGHVPWLTTFSIILLRGVCGCVCVYIAVVPIFCLAEHTNTTMDDPFAY